MDRRLSRDELDELLPLYAVGGLDGEELAQVEEYLESDADARAEVESVREAAGYLTYPLPNVPPSMWAGIEAGMRRSGSQPVAASEPTVGPPRRRARQFAVAAVIVALVAIASSVALGVEVSRQNRRIDHLSALMRDAMHEDSMAKAAYAAKAMPEAHHAVLESAVSNRTAHVVMLPDGTGYFMDSSLAALPAGRTYQLWAKIPEATGDRMVSVGLLGRTPAVVPFRAPGSVTEFDVTDEPDGGAQSPGPNVVTGAI